jgi:O-antigen biosynthesis protein
MSSYIGHTPWKKLKKLFLLAKGIIQVHGLRYFFYVVNIELKKQGFSIFTPDAKPIPLYSQKQFDTKYQIFLKSMLTQLKDEFTLEKIHYMPQISFILQATAENFSDVNLSISSLEEQNYKNWTVKILVSEKIDSFKSNLKKSSQISIIENSKNNSYGKLFSKNSDFVGFLESGVILSPYTLSKFVQSIHESDDCDIIYCDHDYIDKSNVRKNPFFKPDWSPYMLRSMDFLSPCYLIRTSLVEKINTKLTDCLNFDILLQCSEQTTNITHIPLPLVSLKNILPVFFDCKKSVLKNHLERLDIDAHIEEGITKNTFRINYSLTENPKVSIIIPSKNNHHILKRCIDSIEKKTHYKNWEIIIINNSDETIHETIFAKLTDYVNSLPYTVLTYTENFNFSKMNNLAVKNTTSDLLLFLNDDTKILDSFWLDELVSVILQKDVGAVGPKLIYSDNTIQHAGMVFLKTGSGFHPYMKESEKSSGYHNQLNIMREYSSVTGACLLVKRTIFEKVHGFDNIFDAYYGDSDLCLKIRNAGYKIVYTPFTKLLHEGSFSIGGSGASYFAVESHQDFIKKWPSLKNGDPFYNVNLGWDYDMSNLDNIQNN